MLRKRYKVPTDAGPAWWSYAVLPFVATYWFFALLVAIFLLIYVRLTAPRRRERDQSGAEEGGRYR